MRIAAAILAAAVTLTAGSALAQNPNGNPNYGTVNLQGGFLPDPQTLSLRAGGDIGVGNVVSGCSGFITNPPDLRLNYTPGSLPLIISVAAGSDTTLVINAPDGNYYCDDDGGVNGLNPSVRFNSPMSGRYEIWVGTYASGATTPATLYISEVSSQ